MSQQQRYMRQMILPDFGNVAQAKLLAAKVCIVGMGGLGCPILQYLVAAGVGHIGIMDADTVSWSNLNRQLLYNEADLGKLKVEMAAAAMRKQNSAVQISTYPFTLVKENALGIIEQYDLVIDATDNFNAKYLINDVCVLLNKPWIYGAVSRYEGQLSTFNCIQHSNSNESVSAAINYRDLFPVSPMPNEIASCEEAGVLGVLPGIIGTMQAAEAIKIIIGLGKTMYGKLFTYHLLQASWYEINIQKPTQASIINTAFFERTNYAYDCNEKTKAYTNDITEDMDEKITEDEITEDDIEEISVDQFIQMQIDPNFYIVDVRERHEYPPINFAQIQIPMSELASTIHTLPNKTICFICHQGIRSVYAAKQVKAYRKGNVYSLKGGLTAYFKTRSI